MVTAHFKNSSHDATKAEIAFRNLSIDLGYLNTPHTADEPLPPHVYHVMSSYERGLPKTNPLLLAVASVKPPSCLNSPVNFFQIAAHDAVRNDMFEMLQVLHAELGGTPAHYEKIAALKSIGSEELLTSTHQIVSDLQRNVIVSAQTSITAMHHQTLSGLWSRRTSSEHMLAAHLHQAGQHLTEALTLFDAGDIKSAFKLYGQVMRINQKHFSDFASAADTDFYLQFGTSLGVMAGAGLAFAYSGGAALALCTGSATVTETTGIGAYAASLMVGGVAFTGTEKFLNHQIFDVPYFTTNDPFENTMEFAQASLKTAAMVGYLRGFSKIVEVPVATGTGATVINASAGLATEFAGLTSFTALTDGPSVAFAPDTMTHSLATLLGLKLGHAAIHRTVATLPNYISAEMREMAPYPLFLAGRITPIFGALYLMSGKIPAAILSTQLLGLRPTTPRNIALIQLMGRIGKSFPMTTLRSIADFLGASRIGDAIDFADVTLAHLKRAVAGGQNVGFEFEFDPKTMSRDQAHMMIARAFQDAGHPVDVQNGNLDFTFKNQIKVAPIILGRGTIKGQSVRTEVFQSNGTTLVTVARNTDTAKTHVLTTNQTQSLAGADVLLKSMLDAAPKENYIIIAKDDTGDTLKLQVEITGKTTARLTGINGKFYDTSDQLNTSIEIHFEDYLPTGKSTRPQLEAVLAYVKAALPQKLSVQKTNHIAGLHVSDLGSGFFHVVDELPPHLEVISAKMNVGEVDSTKPMIAAFRTGGFDGTRAAKLVGMHVHAEVPRQVAGQFSIAPAFNLLRAFSLSDHLIYELFPSHNNRRGFIQRMPSTMRQRLSDPNYLTDATDPHQILRLLADYVQMTPAKYTDLNLDNFVSAMVNEMGRAGIIRDGQNVETSFTTAAGETVPYRLRVGRGDGSDAPFKLYRRFNPGEVRQVLPDDSTLLATAHEEVEITRNPSGPDKPTAELRLFDSIMDPDSVAFIAQFWGSFVYKYANSIP